MKRAHALKDVRFIRFRHSSSTDGLVLTADKPSERIAVQRSRQVFKNEKILATICASIWRRVDGEAQSYKEVPCECFPVVATVPNLGEVDEHSAYGTRSASAKCATANLQIASSSHRWGSCTAVEKVRSGTGKCTQEKGVSNPGKAADRRACPFV